MKIKNIKNITKDIFTKACVYFTCMTLIITAAATYLNQTIHPGTYFMFALAALGAGASVQIFRIDRLPPASRHIAFFILLYIDFLLIFIPLSQYTVTSNTTFYLSVIFTVIYIVIFGIVMGIKAAVNSAKNRKSNYDKQFKETK